MRKKGFSIFLSLILLISVLLPGTLASASSESTAVADAKSAVVRVLTEFEDGSIATGSAFGVGKLGTAPQYFITNAHNCIDEDETPAKNIYILLDSQAAYVKSGIISSTVDINYAKTVKCDVVNRRDISLYPDVAVIKAVTPVEGRTCLPLLKTSEDVRDVQQVYTLGYPGDMDILGASDDMSSYYIIADIDDVNITSGTVSMKRIGNSGGAFQNTNVIVHTAQISHGNSGGPLVDENGTAIGINTYAYSGDESRFFSIFIDYAIEILEENHIEYAQPGDQPSSGVSTKTIVLCAIIAVIIVAAVLLIIRFKGQGDQYLRNKADQEAQELRIQGVSGVFAGRRFPLDTQVTIGRAPSNGIVFPTDTEGVSGAHCVIINNNQQLYVKDVGSTYGTFLNGTTRIPANQLVSIKVGDRISLGSANETFMVTRKGGKI